MACFEIVASSAQAARPLSYELDHQIDFNHEQQRVKPNEPGQRSVEASNSER